MPEITGIHHLKFAVTNLDVSDAFYTKVFNAKRLRHFDHRLPNGELFGIIMELQNLGTMIELRLNVEAARAHKGFDPVTLAVQSRSDLERWAEHLDRLGVDRSPIFTGMYGWLLAFEDLDGLHIRFYTLETHDWTEHPSRDARWLK